MRLFGPTEIRSLARQLNIQPTKKLGQNFVHDPNTVRRIVKLADVQPGECVLEIGPGLGSLTLGILETGARVTAVEIDHRLAQRLPETVREHAGAGSEAIDRLTVLAVDALQVHELDAQPTRLVANLPYNVSVPVVIHVLKSFPEITSGVVMVQAEVGYRLCAHPGSKMYGVPSVKAAWFGSFRVVGSVGRQVFWPTPNVDSVLVGFHRHASEPGSTELRHATFRVVDAAFGQRRKTLRGALAAFIGSPADATRVLDAAGVDPSSRAEQLAVADFARIARALGVTGTG